MQTLQKIVGLGLLVAALAGCRQPRPDHDLTVVLTDHLTGKKIIQKYTDFNQDGEVDLYVIGPADTEDPTAIDARSPNVKAYVSQKQADIFKASFPGENIGVKTGSDKTGAYIMITSFPATVMDTEMQLKVNSRYHSITSPSLDFLASQPK